MVMETKGKTAKSKWTKHIKIRYFFTNIIHQNKIELMYWYTESMWSDIFTKSLYCAKVRKMQSQHMNHPTDCHDQSSPHNFSHHMPQIVEGVASSHSLQGCIGTNAFHDQCKNTLHGTDQQNSSLWTKTHWVHWQ